MITDPKLLATIISNNIASSDITLDEVEHIVLHYIRLYNSSIKRV
ncbi:hypothetical protein [Nitratiruptor tergarcus]|uniref:Uncharacterized protein n=1 Tax=Nitratiruptor tergarcus DSM 16512 TaxID=1069081 RepID=A0A1W1WSI3_9BACT|nr:hypothetical protein [Nitratiruptor tergarcus]SMC09165.1 hypothetical protein SAMN05660197_0969 [Nitratiruptor tergarcus DSM 16512]